VDTQTLKDLSQVGGGIVAYAILSKVLGFLTKIKTKSSKDSAYCIYCVESLREIKHKLDILISKFQKLGY